MKREKEIFMRRVYPFGFLGFDTKMESYRGVSVILFIRECRETLQLPVRQSRQCSGLIK